MPLTDSHCHLADAHIAPHLNRLLQSAVDCDVTTLLTCATRPQEWSANLAVSHPRLRILHAIGIHPWYSNVQNNANLEELDQLLHSNPSASVGEIGLDGSPRHKLSLDQQRSLFTGQMELARIHNRPASIHCVHAWGPLLKELKRRNGHKPGFLLHACSASPEIIEQLCSLGGFLSIGSSVLNSHAQRMHRAAAEIPQNRLLIETDFPDMLPTHPDATPLPGTTFNHPGNLPLVCGAVAKLRKCTMEHIAAITPENMNRLFNMNS